MADQDPLPVYTDEQISAMQDTLDAINDAIYGGTVASGLLQSLSEKADGLSAQLDAVSGKHLDDNTHDLAGVGEEMVPVNKLVNGLKAQEAAITAGVDDGGQVLSAVAKLISVFV